MDCDLIYDSIIERAKSREYVIGELCEKHHIIPRSCGGSNKKTNQVELTLKEHHICHLLLIRMNKCKSYYFSRLSSKEYIFIKTVEKDKYESRRRKGKRNYITGKKDIV